ncbi:MAG: AAA family ATPase [Spirochaetota bacterium]
MAEKSFAIRGFRGFGDWVEFHTARVNVLYGPNSSGKSSLIQAALLLREQGDPFKLSFVGGAHGLSGFLDAVHGHEAKGTIDFLISCSVDAASALLPDAIVRPEPVPWDFEIFLSYVADPFDGGASGLLAKCTIDLVRDSDRILIFSASPLDDGGELFLSTVELLNLPFVRARLVGSDAGRPDSLVALDKAIELARELASSSQGKAVPKVLSLVCALEDIRLPTALANSVERLVLPDPADADEPKWIVHRQMNSHYFSEEKKYLRSLADILVTEAFTGNGIRAMRSPLSGKDIRLSFYSVFHEILSAAGFYGPGLPGRIAHFPGADQHGSGALPLMATATGTSALVIKAAEEWASLLRDAVNLTVCAIEEGGHAIKGARLDLKYGSVIIASRASRQGLPLVEEGKENDPGVLDLEGRRAVLQSFLSGSGLAEDLEFRWGASEGFSISLAKSGQRISIGELGAGPRRAILLASCLLWLPWGSLVVIEEPEASLDAAWQARIAGLLRELVRTVGASVLVETRSADFVAALGSLELRSRVREKGHKTPEAGVTPRLSESHDGEVRLMELL